MTCHLHDIAVDCYSSPSLLKVTCHLHDIAVDCYSSPSLPKLTCHLHDIIVLLTFIHEYSRLITHLFVKNILIHNGTPKNDDKDILFDDRLAIHL